ncbi:hypothetical protein HRI_002164400 [Hibiscus trionum]|uniref:Uncharacterized protein n=1 Tax=Hibiscus trionum TaxID=183268 RepID=A0A9W7M297_HIBTR|nr:hypothetical protein HRI_002164400 [Hibiscus trionum]
MEEVELEEGEACSYNNNNDDCRAITDTKNDLSSLSYIDEKIQNVLGHLQKDFEGGVSAENLGAKFDGYGSFLPTYTRSPGWPPPKGPPKVQSCRSPQKMTLEVVFFSNCLQKFGEMENVHDLRSMRRTKRARNRESVFLL